VKSAAYVLFAFALLLSVSGCSYIGGSEQAVHTQTAEKVAPKDLKMVAIGDSLTQGVGDSTHRGGYIPYLKKDLESLKMVRSAEFQNFGVKGTRSDQLLERLKTSQMKSAIEKADVVFITIGGNDVMKILRDHFMNLNANVFQQEEKPYQQRLFAILKTIRQYNPHVGIVLIGLYNPFLEWFSDIREINKVIYNWNMASKEVLAKFPHTVFVSIDDIFYHQKENLLFNDHFHPNDQGYHLMANRIYQTINGRKLEELTNGKIVSQKEEKL
jgi:lysophospholipase L1-like esterase